MMCMYPHTKVTTTKLALYPNIHDEILKQPQTNVSKCELAHQTVVNGAYIGGCRQTNY